MPESYVVALRGMMASPRRAARLLFAALTSAAVAFGGPERASAQVTPYIVTHDFTTTFSPLPTGTNHVPVAYGSAENWDEGAARIDLPFSFEFFGRRYTTIWAFTNGFLSFEPPPSNVTIIGPPSLVPNGSNINSYIAPIWQDLDRNRVAGSALPTIRSTVIGAAPNRRFAIEYGGFTRARSLMSLVSFRVTLQEGTQQIQIQYGPNSGIINATAALEGPGGRDGFVLHRASMSCAGSCPCPARTCGSIPNMPNGLLVQLDLPPSPELVPGLEAPPGARPGASFDALVVARNAGLVPAGAFDYDVLLTGSPTSTAGATRLARFRSPALAALGADTATRTLTVPAGTVPGVFHLAVAVDVSEEVNEAFEQNNVLIGPAFRTGPELRGTLAVPPVTGPSERLTVELDIENAGAPDNRTFGVDFFLSQDRQLDAADTRLGSANLQLADGFRFRGPVSITVPTSVPLSPPNFRVLAVLDASGAIPEIDETNNVVPSAGLIRIDGPQLAVVRVRSATVAVRGRPFPVEVVVRNEGGGTARGVTGCVLLSNDASFDIFTEPRLLETAPFDIAPGETQVLDLEPIFPANATSLDRFVGGGIDCMFTVNEGSETDNAAGRGGPVDIRDPAPDFAVDTVVVPALLVAGEQALAQVTVSNRGTSAGATEVALFLSRDARFDAGDLELARETVPALAPFGSARFELAGLVPEPEASGEVFVFAVVEDAGLVTEVNEFDNVAFERVSLSGVGLAIVGSDLPPAAYGRSFAWRFSAVGAEPARTWSIQWASGSAPAGIRFEASGSLEGIPDPAAEGRHTFDLSVRSGTAQATRSFSLLITPPGLPLQVVTRRLAPALRNAPYEQPLVAAGGTPPYRWALATGAALPFGLQLFERTGIVAGEAALNEAATFEVVVSDRFGLKAQSVVALDVIDAEAGLQITTAAVPAGRVSQAYETRFIAVGITGSVVWSVTGGAPGLTVDPATGAYTGAPAAAGTFPILVEVRDDINRRFDRAAFVMEVVERGDLIVIGETALPDAPVGTPYVDGDGMTVRLFGTPDDGTLRWSLLDGRLPAGLTLSESGEITGTPSEIGAQPFVVQVRNDRNELRRATRVIRVFQPIDGPGVDPGGCRSGPDGSLGAALAALLLGLILGRRRFHALD